MSDKKELLLTVNLGLWQLTLGTVSKFTFERFDLDDFVSFGVTVTYY